MTKICHNRIVTTIYFKETSYLILYWIPTNEVGMVGHIRVATARHDLPSGLASYY